MRLQYGLGSIGFFLEIVSKCALIITSVELGNGYMYALTKQRSRAQTTARSLGFASVIPLIILAIVDTAWDGVVSKEYYDLLYSDNDSYVDRGFDAVLDKLHKINNVRLTIIVLNCAITIGLMVQAAIVQHKYRGIQPAGRVSSYPNTPPNC